MPIRHLGKLIEDISSFDKYIEISENFEIIPLKASWPGYPFWLRYLSGNILFAMNMKRHPILREMLDRTEVILRDIMPKQYPINRELIHLVKTSGFVKPHCDHERWCSINIGLRNSSSAITRICTSDDNSLNSFGMNNIEFSVTEGHGYLFNTKQRHSVTGSETSRYIISYGTGIPYSVLSEEILCRQ